MNRINQEVLSTNFLSKHSRDEEDCRSLGAVAAIGREKREATEVLIFQDEAKYAETAGPIPWRTDYAHRRLSLSFPGGARSGNETPIETIAEEMKEELRLKTEIDLASIIDAVTVQAFPILAAQIKSIASDAIDVAAVTSNYIPYDAFPQTNRDEIEQIVAGEVRHIKACWLELSKLHQLFEAFASGEAQPGGLADIVRPHTLVIAQIWWLTQMGEDVMSAIQDYNRRAHHIISHRHKYIPVSMLSDGQLEEAANVPSGLALHNGFFDSDGQLYSKDKLTEDQQNYLFPSSQRSQSLSQQHLV